MQAVLRTAPAVALWPAVSLAHLRAHLSGSLLGRYPALRRIFAAGIVSGVGDRLNQIALAALILAITDSVAQAGLVFVVSLVPYILFGLVAGALVDRWDRRACLVGADVARAALVALIPLAASASLPLVYGLLFGVTCARMIFTPAQQAVVPDLVEREDLVKANSLIRTAQHLTDVIGFPFAGALVAVLVAQLGPLAGTQVAFGLDALSFAGSAALLWGLPASDRSVGSGGARTEALPAQIIVGLRFLFGHPGVRLNTILFTAGALLLSSVQVLWVAFAWRVSETGAAGYGVLTALMGAGTFTGVLVVPRLSKRLGKGRTILLGFSVMGSALFGMGNITALGPAAALAFVSGVGNMLFLVTSVAYVQQQTPSELRGRVFGVRLMLTYSAVSLSNAVAGWLTDVVGAGAVMLSLGGAALAMAGVAYLIPSAREAN